MEEELETCPICKRKPICTKNSTGELWEIRCSHYDAPPLNNGVSHVVIVTGWRKEDAIKEWNSRQ